jgi:hypothetical protein
MRAGMAAEAAGVQGKHFAMHKTAIGQDFEQSGRAGFWSGQHGMPAGIEAISDMDASSIAALDGFAIGAVKRPRIARIESRRHMSEQSCTQLRCHRARRERRVNWNTFSSVLPTYSAPAVARLSLFVRCGRMIRLSGFLAAPT